MIFLPGENEPLQSDKTIQVASIAAPIPVPPYGIGLFSTSRMYYPKVDDLIIGVVVYSYSDGYRLDINAPFEANLPSTAFNNATKLNRPKLQLGSVVICKVSWTGCLGPKKHVARTKQLPRYATMDSTESLSLNGGFQLMELNDSCDVTCEMPLDPRNWSSNEVYLGELERDAGYLFDIPICYSKSLQGDRNYLFDRLGEIMPFEVAVGINGSYLTSFNFSKEVWLKGTSTRDTLLISRLIQRSHGLDLPQLEFTIQSWKETNVMSDD